MAEVWEPGVGLEWHFKFFEDLSVCLTAVWVTLFLVHHRFALQIKPKAWHNLQSGAITLCATMLAKVFFKIL